MPIARPLLLALRIALCCGAGFLLLGGFPARAATVSGLYRATVPASGSDEAARAQAFQQAMRIVIVRATGRRDAADAPGIAELIAQAGRHVQTLRPVAGGQLDVAFDGTAIENAIAAAGLPYWSAERPQTLVWLAVDRGNGQRGIVTATTQSDERRAVELVAQQRGVPIAWPALAAGDDPLRRYTQIASGSTAGLATEAGRLGYEGVLIGRAVTQPGGNVVVNWSLQGAGLAAQTVGGLADGPHLAADRYAGAFASIAAAKSGELLVTVTGIDGLSTYAGAMRALDAAEGVRSVQLVEAAGDRVVFRLAARGDAATLARAIGARRDLVPVADGGGLSYQYRP
jgi:hypothetical protein